MTALIILIYQIVTFLHTNQQVLGVRLNINSKFTQQYLVLKEFYQIFLPTR